MTGLTLEQEILDAMAAAGVPQDCYQLQRAIEARRAVEDRPHRFLFWNWRYSVSVDAIKAELDGLIKEGVVTREGAVQLEMPPRFWLPHKD